MKITDTNEILQILNKSRKQLIIVEGKNDKKALEKFGCVNVITINKPLYKIIEDIESKNISEVIILTDLDSHGKKLYGYFYQEFTKRGIKVNNKLRHVLTYTHLDQIEGLPKFIKKNLGFIWQ